MAKKERYAVGKLLQALRLERPTYYDERIRIAKYHDKYAEVKAKIYEIAQRGLVRGRYTLGYRRIQSFLVEQDIHLADATVLRLMNEMGVQVKLYNQHRNHCYSSYRGTIGKVPKNLLRQKFNATKPYQVLHTDVSQVKLANQQWAYISAVIDEASKEVLAFQIGAHPNAQLIKATLSELKMKLPDVATPIIHSDQGWHYQLAYYTQKISEEGFTQSMSRKGNCLDNAPMESFFHLYKTELLSNRPLCKDLAELSQLSHDYIHFFNYERISLKTKGMTPVAYRNHAYKA